MQTVLLGFFTHNQVLYLYIEDESGKEREIQLPIKQANYDPFVMSVWSRQLTPLAITVDNEHITFTETLPNGELYNIKFRK